MAEMHPNHPSILVTRYPYWWCEVVWWLPCSQEWKWYGYFSTVFETIFV
jgi:hypothetical protein